MNHGAWGDGSQLSSDPGGRGGVRADQAAFPALGQVPPREEFRVPLTLFGPSPAFLQFKAFEEKLLCFTCPMDLF